MCCARARVVEPTVDCPLFGFNSSRPVATVARISSFFDHSRAPMKVATKRMTIEISRIQKEPPPGVVCVRPAKDNLLDVHFVIAGADDTPYAGGQYWGHLIYPQNVSSAAKRNSNDTHIANTNRNCLTRSCVCLCSTRSRHLDSCSSPPVGASSLATRSA